MPLKEKLGLALGAGGARGFAHLAVLNNLNKRDILPDIVTGSSMGAVIGSAFALSYNVESVNLLTRYFLSISKEKISFLINGLQGKMSLSGQLNIAIKTTTSPSIMGSDFLYEILSKIFGKAKFSDTKIPLGVVSTDFITGRKELITSGYIVDAVCASATVPGAFSPARLGGTYFVDGGVTRLVPVDEAISLGADKVIGVDVGNVYRKEIFENPLDFLTYIDDLKGEKILHSDMKRAFIKIFFSELNTDWFRFDKFREIMKEAEDLLETRYKKELDSLSLTVSI